MKIENIIFAQGEEAEEYLALLDSKGPGAVIDIMSQAHDIGHHEIMDEFSAGTSDETYRDKHGYVLSWNTRLGYVGLEYIAERGQE
jgi:hypothetical protein